MKKASGFKMKNPSIAKLAKAAGSPMKIQSTKDINKRIKEQLANRSTGDGLNVNFDTAFGDARKAGKKTFNYKGKSYTTETKQEKANRTADKGPTVKNAKNNVDLSKTTKRPTTPDPKPMTATVNNTQGVLKNDKGNFADNKGITNVNKSTTTTKGKKKFKDTKLGKFLSKKRVKGALIKPYVYKKKTYNSRLNRFE